MSAKTDRIRRAIVSMEDVESFLSADDGNEVGVALDDINRALNALHRALRDCESGDAKRNGLTGWLNQVQANRVGSKTP